MSTWSILIATMPYRQDLLERLLKVLLPQADQFPGRVEVVALRNKGVRTIGEYRQALLADARGGYVSFVDDDDLVEPDFVPVVMGALESEPDYVAFRHQLYWGKDAELRPTVTGLSLGGWYDTDEVMARDITHINPVRTDLARQAGFVRGGAGEDKAYVDKLRPLLKTEVVIDRVLYHYFYDPPRSATQALGGLPAFVRLRSGAPLPVRSSAFRWHEASVMR